MWDKKILALTDKNLTGSNFLKQIEKLCKAGIDGLILREKNLSEDEYLALAREVLAICAKNKTTCFLHNFERISLKLNHRLFHAPLDLLRAQPKLARYFQILGSSVHSKEELLEAINYKANYALAGHIFQSSCKADLAPRGVEFLEDLTKFSTTQIYALGGINLENLRELKDLKISGICMREALMCEKNPKNFIKECKRILNS